MPMRLPITLRAPAMNSYVIAGTVLTVSGSPANWWRRTSVPELKIRPVVCVQPLAARNSISLVTTATTMSATMGKKISPTQNRSDLA